MTIRNMLVPAFGVGLSFILILASLGIGEAACNSLPPASELSTGAAQVPPVVAAPNATPQALPASLEGAFRYKATLGRVDGVFFAPGEGEQLRLAADDLCVGGPADDDAAPRITNIGPIEDLAVFVAFDAAPGHAVPVWPYTGAAKPPISILALQGALRDRPRVKGEVAPVPVHFVLGDHWDRRVKGVPIVRGVDGVYGVSIAVPSLVGEVAVDTVEKAHWNLESSSVRILAIHMDGKTAEDLAADVGKFLSSSCSAICATLKPSGAAVCLDRIYSRPLPPDTQKVFPYAEDAMLCSVDIPQLPLTPPSQPNPQAQENKHNAFADVCEPGSPLAVKPVGLPGSKPTATAASITPVLVSCEQTASTLKFWRSSCGGIHIPLDYTNIRVRQQSDGSGRTPVKRHLYGQSGVGREFDADEKRIYVPGREFVGSTPDYDSSSHLPDTKWRLPNLDVWYPDGQESAESGLTGVADKNESIIHIFPRMPAVFVCPPTGVQPLRGCMGVNSAGAHCACEDTGLTGCTCDRLHLSGEFFACDAGDRTNMPCTRDDHCKSRDTARNGGSCSRQPICREANTVWRRKAKNEDPDPPGAVACRTDADCADGQQCGYSLFDFENRVDGNGWYRLDRDVVVQSPSGRIRRGACAHDRDLTCNNDAVSPNVPEVCPESKRCRGYRLTAGDEEP